jgi:hypothetical protein
MKPMKAVAILGLGLLPLFSGCAGSGPNTEQGAVAGGALGALAGGIIGHNSGSGNTRNTVNGAVLGAAAGAVAGGAIGNSVDHERGTIYAPTNPPPSQAPVVDERGPRRRGARTIPPPPPTPAEAIPPAPAPNAVWVAGYWIYDGRTYTWQSGHWEIPVVRPRY